MNSSKVQRADATACQSNDSQRPAHLPERPKHAGERAAADGGFDGCDGFAVHEVDDGEADGNGDDAKDAGGERGLRPRPAAADVSREKGSNCSSRVRNLGNLAKTA